MLKCFKTCTIVVLLIILLFVLYKYITRVKYNIPEQYISKTTIDSSTIELSTISDSLWMVYSESKLIYLRFSYNDVKQKYKRLIDDGIMAGNKNEDDNLFTEIDQHFQIGNIVFDNDLISNHSFRLQYVYNELLKHGKVQIFKDFKYIKPDSIIVKNEKYKNGPTMKFYYLMDGTILMGIYDVLGK